MEQRLSFPQQLKRERELRNWSQEELAARVGTDPKTVSRWENGGVLPRPESREALCKPGKKGHENGTELKRHRHTGDIVQRRLLEHALLELIESGIGSIPVAVEDRAARDSWVARH